MKKLIFTALVGLAMVAFTGCTTADDAKVGAKCAASGKCVSSKKCAAGGKCTGNKAKAAKCAASGKCGAK